MVIDTSTVYCTSLFLSSVRCETEEVSATLLQRIQNGPRPEYSITDHRPPRRGVTGITSVCGSALMSPSIAYVGVLSENVLPDRPPPLQVAEVTDWTQSCGGEVHHGVCSTTESRSSLSLCACVHVVNLNVQGQPFLQRSVTDSQSVGDVSPHCCVYGL